MRRVRPQTGQEMCVVSAVVISLSFLCFILPCYSDDGGVKLFVDKFVEGEQRLFTDYGICKSENRSSFSVCDTDVTEPVQDLVELKRSSCYCDDRCSLYHDCCINKCPASWEDEFVRDMCEMESTTRQAMGLSFDHLQDMPVQGESTRVLYRNIYCAICNKDIPVVKWETFMYCNGDSENPRNSLMDNPDFSTAYYDPRAMNFRKVKVGDRLKNCAIIVKNFDLKKLLSEYGARLCKPVISSCPEETDWQTKDKCGAYSAYVYQKVRSGNRRKVFKNFHCALCHGAPVESLCLHFVQILLTTFVWSTMGKKARDASLTMLFDFNFEGRMEEVGRLSPCLLQEGQIWGSNPRNMPKFHLWCFIQERRIQMCPFGYYRGGPNGLKDSCPKSFPR
ncbi:g_PROTEIN_RECEP_F2_4 domain-containing protein [Caerostris extrusa]|uniref:G_PROTEIN_RECEP_F2_4 domain-containing protein n=1 Tax=Caerostris extrusa TaxID=172846 RepID=A0AAV4YAE5_CAEEX|nr:g_PROTEIN_RECEP_F2_4 domain-containing protein [Caerostris extrusa]